MIQKRREQFKKQIRRKQLECIFRQRRMELLEPLHFQQYLLSIQTSNLGKWITQSIMNIQRYINLQNQSEIQRIFTNLFIQLRQNTFQASAYLIILSQKMSQMFKIIIENEEGIEEGQQRKKLSSYFQRMLIVKYLQLFSLINYRQLRQEQYFQLISSFWLIFTSGQIQINLQQNHHIFDLVLKTIKQMLSSKSCIVLSNLKSMGIGLQLTKIIQYDDEFLTNANELILIQIIHFYVSLQSMFNENTFVQNINGTTILGIQTSQKKVLMAFCLYIINKRYEQGYYCALDALVLIFEKHQHLISSLGMQYAQQIGQLIIFPNPKIQQKALQLVDDIIYRDNDKGSQFLKNGYLPNILHRLLINQFNQPGPYTRSFCCIASNIISNLTLCKNSQIQNFVNHPIWQFSYEHIQMSSPLLPLVSSFQFYFEIIHRKTALRLLQNYLCSVGLLQFHHLQKRQAEAIKRIIQRVYIHCLDFWPQDYEYKLRRFIEQNNLRFLLQDLMEIEQQNQLKSL